MRTLTALTAAFFALVLVAAGCGSSSSAGSAASAAPAASGVAAPTKHFSSPRLGVSFAYPESWNVRVGDPFAAIVVRSPGPRSGQMVLTMDVRSDNMAVGARPEPFGDATAATLRSASDVAALTLDASGADGRVVWSGFSRVGGVRVAGIEWTADQATSDSSTAVGLHNLVLMSLSIRPDGSQVSQFTYGALAPEPVWRAQEATMDAIVRSVRLSTPRGDY